MKRGLFRDALLVVAPCACVLAGLASVDHHQRLVETGYRVAKLEKERDDLALDVDHRRVRVGNLSSPVRLLSEARNRKLPLDYPIAWNRVNGDGEAAALLAARSAPKPAAKGAPGAPPASVAPRARRPSSAPGVVGAGGRTPKKRGKP